MMETNGKSSSAGSYTEESAAAAVASMRVGWNLGNTYECHGKWFDNVRTETSWGNPITSRDLIRYLAKSGFSAVRVPVTWYNHVDSDGTVSDEWLRRVRRVVRMVLAEGMYCIIDSHHDVGAMDNYGGSLFRAERANYEEKKALAADRFRQIAEYFREESERLIFEGFNEVLDDEFEWTMPSADEMDVVNYWNQLFVEAVRATGGNNATRNLLLNPYAAGSSEYILSGFRVPKDTTEGHLILGLHTYAPDGFTSRAATWARQTDEFDCLGEEEVERVFLTIGRAKEEIGLPAIVSDFGAMNRNNPIDRARHAEVVAAHSHALGIPCFYWDDGSQYAIIDRNAVKALDPLLLSAMMRAGGAEPKL